MWSVNLAGEFTSVATCFLRNPSSAARVVVCSSCQTDICTHPHPAQLCSVSKFYLWYYSRDVRVCIALGREMAGKYGRRRHVRPYDGRQFSK